MKSKNNFVGKLRSVSVLAVKLRLIGELRKIIAVVLALLTVATFVALAGCDDDDEKTSISKKSVTDTSWDIEEDGGVEVIFSPIVDVDGDCMTDDIPRDDLDFVKQTLEARLQDHNIVGYEVSVDYSSKNYKVRFPWQTQIENFDPMKIILDIRESGAITFYKGTEKNENQLVLRGAADIAGATYGGYDDMSQTYLVNIEMTEQGTAEFAKATREQIGKYISIYLGDVLLAAPMVNTEITNGMAVITGMSTADEAIELANKINSGGLPFDLGIKPMDSKVISPDKEVILP